jgi:dephospho-CoA kinase
VLRVGLTGGIGAGKSTVSAELAALGAVVVDADLLARRAVEPGTPGLAEVVEAFGDGVLAPDGTLDRPALARVAFADDASRRRLNGILHPRIAELTVREMAAAPADAVVVHDVPLLVENGLAPNYQLVLVVSAPADERVRRLVTERGMTESQVRARMAAQADDGQRTAVADVLLDNGGDPADVREAVRRLWHERLLPLEANLRLGRCADAPQPADAGGRARAAARLRTALGDRGHVEDSDDSDDSDRLLVRVRRDLPDDRLAAALERAGLVLGPDGEVCAADPLAALAVRLLRE